MNGPNKLEKAARDKYSSLLGTFLSYGENEVLCTVKTIMVVINNTILFDNYTISSQVEYLQYKTVITFTTLHFLRN